MLEILLYVVSFQQNIVADNLRNPAAQGDVTTRIQLRQQGTHDCFQIVVGSAGRQGTRFTEENIPDDKNQ